MRIERGKMLIAPVITKIALLLLFLLTMTTAVQASIIGSKHDFSGKGWGTNEICIFCHTPHHAAAVSNVGSDSSQTCVGCHSWWSYGTPKSYPSSQLCNRRMSTAVYTLYSSSSLKGSPQQPRGPSKLCLSCHDGTIAIDSYGMREGTKYVTGPADIGTDLSKMHPISIKWDHQTVKMTMGNPACMNCHHEQPTSGNGAYKGLPFYGYSSQMYLECGSCHEPHNKFTYPKMVRFDMAGSKMCLVCHQK